MIRTYLLGLLCLLLVAGLQAAVIPGKAYMIRSVAPGEKSLFTPNASLNSGASVIAWVETRVPAQRWIAEKAGDSLFFFTNAYSGMQLSESVTRPKPGDRMVQKHDKTDLSKWEIVPSNSAAYPSSFYIRFGQKMAGGVDLFLELSENIDGSLIKLEAKRDDADSVRQLWRLTAEEILPNTVTPSFRDSVMRGWKSRYFNLLKTSTGFWGEAEMMEILLDAYETTGKLEYKIMFEETYENFVSYPAGWGQKGNGLDWRWNEYNDDIAWAVLASVRAYLMFGNHPNAGINYLTIAKNNFDWMFARALLPSGMLRWKQTPSGNQGTNSCVNGPSIVAACYLAIATGDDSYNEKAKNLYALQRQYLYSPATGRVYDSGSWNNGVFTIGNHWVSTYNQGTFLGAALMLHRRYRDELYVQDAHKVVERTRLDLCNSHGVINVCGSGDDLQGFKGILMRYLRRYIVDLAQTNRVEWMQRNALQAYNNRNSDGVIWTAWWEKTSENYVFSDGYRFADKAFGTSTAVSAAFNAPLSADLIVKNAYATIEAEHFDYLKGVLVERSDDSTALVANIADGYYTAYYNVDFNDELPLGASFFVQGSRQSGRSIEIRLGSPVGLLIGKAEIPSVNTGEWVSVECDIQAVNGRQNIYLVYRGSGFKVDHFHFLKSPNSTHNPEGSTAFSVYPNPTSGMVNVSSGADGVLNIYDVRGNVVRNIDVLPGTSQHNWMDLQEGVYFLQLLQVDGNTERAILVKQN